ncbi:hypothetical protein [Embleya hyalina]|uniref:hypothetical protein n=1 Tax=Embleya hyalina TaxID=516124 RepID=UPI000F823546|nr:hypothetical protein [Embleya hyalina]
MVLSLLVASGCAAQRPTNTPEAFRQAVTALVGPATFSAKTCGSLFDGDPNSALLAKGTSTVPASSVAGIRTRALAAGWQPQKHGGFTLALLGPDHYQIGVRVTGDSAVVRAELDRCSVRTRSSMLGNAPLPIPEPGQRQSLERAFALATPVVRELLRAAGVAARDDLFPESGSMSDADAVPPENCRTPNEGRLGVTWRAVAKAELPVSTDVAGFFARLTPIPGPDWTVAPETPRDDPQVNVVTREGVRIRVHTTRQTSGEGGASLELRVSAESACVPVTTTPAAP